MKRVYLFLTIACIGLMANPLSAQRGLKVGAYFMPQATWLLNRDDLDVTDDDLLKYELTTGVAGGLTLGFNPGRFFGFRLNLAYSQQGQRLSYKRNFNERVNTTTRLEYIKLPFMIGLHSNPENQKIMVSVYGGIQPGFLTRAYVYDDNPEYVAPLPDTYTKEPKTWQLYERFNFSLVGEFGLDIRLTEVLALNLAVRGEHSVLDAENKDITRRVTQNGVTTEELVWSDDRAKTRNAILGLRIGVTYTLIKEEEVVTPPVGGGGGVMGN